VASITRRVQATAIVSGRVDDECVRRLLGGDEDAFRVVYRAVQPGLVRYLTVLVGSADAEDVAAEAWAQAFRDLGRFSGDADGFRGWVTTIARHRALDLLRARARRPVVDSDVAELADLAGSADFAQLPVVPAAETEAVALVSTRDALRLIATLPPDQAEAVLLRAVVGLDAPTAARVLGKRAGAVRTAAYRGLRTLGRRISAADSDTSPGPDAEGSR
jgi:RNA polymerase sigma-70 factor (ECF subfamily)